MNLFAPKETIEFRGPWITNWSLPHVNQLSKLAMLSLINTAVTDRGIQRLKEAVNLTEFSMKSILISDRSMPVLCNLPQLQSLIFWYAPRISDKGIACLKQRTKLSELYLAGTRATDIAIESIIHLEGLWSLSLRNTRVTDSGIAKLSGLKHLRLITLQGNNITGRSLRELPNSPHLGLYLQKCPICDEGVIAASEQLTNLKYLDLNFTLVSDKSLHALSNLPHLEDLRLNNTSVTDAGILNLRGHATLSSLYVENTHVTDSAIRELKEASSNFLMIYH